MSPILGKRELASIHGVSILPFSMFPCCPSSEDPPSSIIDLAVLRPDNAFLNADDIAQDMLQALRAEAASSYDEPLDWESIIHPTWSMPNEKTP